MSKQLEVHQNEWKGRANIYSNDGIISEMEKSELYDLTWKTTSNIIIQYLELNENQKVFDAGFGWGRIIHGIKYNLPGINIEGIELTKELYEHAISLFSRQGINGVKLHHGDILDLKEFPSNHFDAIYSSRVLHYIMNKRDALNNLYRILKPSGKIIIIIPNRYCPYRWFSYNHPLYSVKRIKKIMKSIGFQKLENGSVGFIPTNFGRFSHKSKLYIVEKFAQNIIGLNQIGGLAFVFGEKNE